MRNFECLVAACRYCQHYTPEGRRGGNCQKLGVPVQAGWEACPLMIPAFSPSWEELRRVMDWREQSGHAIPVEVCEPTPEISPPSFLVE